MIQYYRFSSWKKDAVLVPSERWNVPGIDTLCSGDALTFSASEPTSILATASFSFGSMKLPTNGELILGNNVQFGSSVRINGCTENRQLSYSSVPDEWYDIENWQVPSVPGDHLLLDEKLVPCQSDGVIFEPFSTFMVQGLAAVKQIEVAQQTISNAPEFFDYKQNAKSGEYQFQHLDLKFSPSCPVSGCPCHPAEMGPVLDNLCEKVNCTSPSELPCSSGKTRKQNFPGIDSLETETSGKTGALTGGAIFGIIFAIIFAAVAGFFVFTRKDQLFIRRGDFSNPVHSDGAVNLSEMGDTGNRMSEASSAGKKRAPPPPTTLTSTPAETIMTLQTEQYKQVDGKFGTSADGVINVNFEEFDEEENSDEDGDEYSPEEKTGKTKTSEEEEDQKVEPPENSDQLLDILSE
ncbi:Oidioi.mRNA.OKI2018_I69.chr2.g3971.t1.cds [Oikopleura dioica]|uniref:Protein amnionless n=1 Tax=Oikopleura dioica TaxID=34765 RepID=A0ABN7T027_OIKDI|nr:Oidioi.mRNA.OKI2018_I69.chr2.g3971.t1.cds [Oikopleura dioica]